MSIHDGPQTRQLKWLRLQAFWRKARDVLFAIALLIGIILILPVTLPIALLKPYKGDDFDGYC